MSVVSAQFWVARDFQAPGHHRRVLDHFLLNLDLSVQKLLLLQKEGLLRQHLRTPGWSLSVLLHFLATEGPLSVDWLIRHWGGTTSTIGALRIVDRAEAELSVLHLIGVLVNSSQGLVTLLRRSGQVGGEESS
jgi:hypothetical protein